MKTKLLTLLVALIATTALWASNTITYTATSQLPETTSTSGGKGLHTNAFNVSILSHTFSNGTGTITFNGEITTIGNYAFQSCSGLTSITIPNSITTIGNYAFSACSGLTSITIPNSITTIGNSAFQSCSGLTSITIPNSVTTIGNSAFSGCSGLTKTNYTGTIADWCKIKFGALSAANPMCYSHNFYINDVEVKDLVIPDEVDTIGERAFYGCSGLTSVTIPNSITTIGNYAFSACSGLTSITIPNSITTIGNSAFQSCSGLTSITIPNSVTTIGNSAFDGCISLTSVTIPNSVTTIGNSAFSGCSGLTKTNYTGTIADWCKIKFDNSSANPMYCSHNFYINDVEVKDLVIPDGVDTIGNYAFFYCSKLISVTIPNSVTTIGDWAFYKCSGLTSITIPNSVTTIGESAFRDCSRLTSVTIPNSVTTIGNCAFEDCRGLTSVTIPNSVTTIGKSAFYYCSGLTSVTIPNSVTTIGDYAFQDCSGLKTVTWNAKNCNGYNFGNQVETFIFGGSVEVIPASICNGMIKLTSVTIPNSVTTIGGEAFYKCSGLSDIYSYATIPPSCEAEEVFYGVSQHCYIHVPVGTVRAYELAFGWSHFLHFFEISEVPVGGTDQVGVEVTNNTAVFSWPVNPTASSYTLVIKKNDEVFCTLTFNSLGQLVGMSFAPARGANNDSSAQSTAYGYSFMVSNLDASSTYDYTFTAKDASNNVLTTTTGQFKTGGTATDILPLLYEDNSLPFREGLGVGFVKFIKDGHLLIERNGILFDAHGARVK